MHTALAKQAGDVFEWFARSVLYSVVIVGVADFKNLAEKLPQLMIGTDCYPSR
jgi:hypothetical protein